MFTFWHHHQHDIEDTSGVECEPTAVEFSSDEGGSDTGSISGGLAVLSLGSMSSDDQKLGIVSMPPEIMLHMINYLNASDIVELSLTCKYFNDFAYRCARALPRFDMSCIEFRAMRGEFIIMNLSCPYRGSNRLWKSLQFRCNDFADMELFEFTRRIRLYDNGVIRVVNTVFQKTCLPALCDFIENCVRCDYPIYQGSTPFELQLTDCDFLRVSVSDIATFINKMIDLGCTKLGLNGIQQEDFIKICKACGQSKIQLLDVLRLHSDEITSARTEPLKWVFDPFCKKTRKTSRIVIDGIQVPLMLAEWIMISFCCTPFYEVPPPALRIVLAIHHTYSRQELFDMLANVRGGVNLARSSLRHRLNHVYLELGMYESDVYLTKNQHCVVDVKLMRHRREEQAAKERRQ